MQSHAPFARRPSASARCDLAAANYRAQATPWYLQLNPEGSVPVLVRTPEGGAEEVVAGTRAILSFVDAKLPGSASLMPPAGTPARATCMGFLDLHDAVDAEDVAFAFGDVITRVQVSFARVRAELARLTAVRDDEAADAKARQAAGARVDALQTRLKRWEAPDELCAEVERRVLALLDALEAELTKVGSGPLACGAQYTLADAALTVFLAHAMRHGKLADHVRARKQVRLYYSEVASRRPSFAKADVWTGPRLGKMPELILAALAAPFLAIGALWHRHVATPIAHTAAYKAAAMALVDFHNDCRVPLEEEVKPAIAAGVTTYVVEPAQAAGDAIHVNVIAPVAEAGAAVADGVNTHVVTHVANAASATSSYVSDRAKCVAAAAQHLLRDAAC